MKELSTDWTKNRNLWLSMFFAAVLPMLLGFMLANYFPAWRWSHYPFHSMVESVGAISAITIAILMVLMVNTRHLPRYYIWPACALIGMGILDGFHAVLHAGHAFVWLHSVATMFGGLIFAAIWLPEKWLTDRYRYVLIIFTLIAVTFIGLFSIVNPNLLPNMIVNGEFSHIAKFLNIAGGIGFLMGSVYFVRHKLREQNKGKHGDRISKDHIFANHCLLFGIAGLLFESSVIWDAGWWWWHVLRLVAYLVVLVYLFVLFKQQQDLLVDQEIKLRNINKQLEQRVYERTKELEKASRAKSDFLSSMSHELRTPMNAVLGFAQMLKFDEDKFNEMQRSNVNEILDAGEHLLKLINEVLDLSKIESGNMSVVMGPVHLDKLIKECITLMKPQINSHQIILINNIRNKDYIVSADATRVKQVLINLLSNAVKYNSEHGRITLDAKIHNMKTLRINVTDTGDGLTEEEISKLFTSFERLNIEDCIEGTGIGLAITRHLAKLMNGTVGVESTPDEGSTFWVEFELFQN